MLSSKRKRTRATGVLGPIARGMVIAAAASAAGCSADVTRFDFSSKNTTSSIPVPPEPVRNGYGPSAAPRGLGLTEAPLPPSQPPDNYRMTSRPYDAPPSAPSFAERPPSAEPPRDYRVVGRQYKNAPPPHASLAEPPQQLGTRPSFNQPPPDSSGNVVEVQHGETLFSISRRHGVSPAAIKEANGLSSDTLRPGQRLVMPADLQDRAPVARTRKSNGILRSSVPTSPACTSTSLTRSSSTVTFFWRLRIPRIGQAMSDGASPAVATW